MPLDTRLVRHLSPTALEESEKVAQILQRIYKYGGQPFARDFLAKNYGDSFDRTFGKGNGKAVMHATAGRSVTSAQSRDKRALTEER